MNRLETITFLADNHNVNINQKNIHGKTLLDIVCDRFCDNYKKIAEQKIAEQFAIINANKLILYCPTNSPILKKQLEDDWIFIHALENIGAKTTEQLTQENQLQ